MRFELKSPVKTIEDFIKRFTPSRLTSGSNSSSSSSLVTNRSSTRGCSSLLTSPSAESTLTKLAEERPPSGLEQAFSPVPPCSNGQAWNVEEGELRYEAESPDEAALVYAARAYKCSLVGRLPDQVTVELPHLGKLSFELLHTLGFDSTRKRMSVVVKHPLTDQITVYTKGADSVIMDLIKPPDTGKKQPFFLSELSDCLAVHNNFIFTEANWFIWKEMVQYRELWLIVMVIVLSVTQVTWPTTVGNAVNNTDLSNYKFLRNYTNHNKKSYQISNQNIQPTAASQLPSWFLTCCGQLGEESSRQWTLSWSRCDPCPVQPCSAEDVMEKHWPRFKTTAAKTEPDDIISVTVLSLWSDHVVIWVASYLSLFPAEMMNHSGVLPWPTSDKNERPQMAVHYYLSRCHNQLKSQEDFFNFRCGSWKNVQFAERLVAVGSHVSSNSRMSCMQPRFGDGRRLDTQPNKRESKFFKKQLSYLLLCMKWVRCAAKKKKYLVVNKFQPEVHITNIRLAEKPFLIQMCYITRAGAFHERPSSFQFNKVLV